MNWLSSLFRRRLKKTPPYTTLAQGYDVVMAHVDYEGWAAYVHRLLQRHHPEAREVLELGCGTGTLSLLLQPLGPYRYTPTDSASAMLDVARRKAKIAEVPIHFDEADFTQLEATASADAVLLIYDGLNYLLKEEQVRALLRGVHQALRPGGVFIFDQSTPANSVNNSFEGEGILGSFGYVRRSRYDEERRLHFTLFGLQSDGRRCMERHVQRAYTLEEIRALVEESPLDEEAAYHEHTTDPATPETERIHWVLRKDVDA